MTGRNSLELIITILSVKESSTTRRLSTLPSVLHTSRSLQQTFLNIVFEARFVMELFGYQSTSRAFFDFSSKYDLVSCANGLLHLCKYIITF